MLSLHLYHDHLLGIALENRIKKTVINILLKQTTPHLVNKDYMKIQSYFSNYDFQKQQYNKKQYVLCDS